MKTSDPHDPSDAATARDDAIVRLLKAARDEDASEPSAERADRVRANVHAAWTEDLGQATETDSKQTRPAQTRPAQTRPAQTRRARAWLLAAALAMAAFAAAWILRTHEPAPAPARTVVATVRSLTGTVLRAESRGAVGTALATGDPLHEGDILRTGIGRLAFAITMRPDGGPVGVRVSSADVRVDRDSELRIGTGGAIELDRGALYAATRGGGTDPLLRIVTPFGTARDIGTRFAVRVADGLEVAVREGAVEVATEHAFHRADAGMAITVSTSGETSSRQVEPFDPLWTWTAMLAPTFELDGASLQTFLTWLRRESGWTIRFADPRLEREAARWEMHGPVIENMRLEEALALALTPNALEFDVAQGVVTIGEAGTTPIGR